MKKPSHTVQIGLALILAVIAGILLRNQADFVNTYIHSIGTPGIPGGSLALMAMVFASAGIPVECVAVAAGIDRIIDMGRTVMSVTGDASCAVVMQRIVGKKL